METMVWCRNQHDQSTFKLKLVVSIGTRFETHARHIGSFSQGFRAKITKNIWKHHLDLHAGSMFWYIYLLILPIKNQPCWCFEKPSNSCFFKACKSWVDSFSNHRSIGDLEPGRASQLLPIYQVTMVSCQFWNKGNWKILKMRQWFC